jgi:AbrB family looped-hinge helix DNA binding protein
VRRDGQITLPTSIRKTLGIKAGALVEVELAAENVIVIKLKEFMDQKKVEAQSLEIKKNLVNINKTNPVKEVNEEELEAMTDSAKKRVFERYYANRIKDYTTEKKSVS